jgi:hypothetical protein
MIHLGDRAGNFDGDQDLAGVLAARSRGTVAIVEADPTRLPEVGLGPPTDEARALCGREAPRELPQGSRDVDRALH